MAKFLMKGGKDDLAKKAYDAALTKFERAEREDPTLLESVYCQALALDRKGDAGGAIQAYRRYLTAMEKKSADGPPSKDDAALLKKAQERLDALAAGGAERRKLDDAFVEALMAFARTNFVKDPTVTREALSIVADVRPENAEAKKMLDKLGGPLPRPDERKTPDPVVPAADAEQGFKAVKAWRDLLEERRFGDNPGWMYETDKLVIDSEGASISRPATVENTSTSYAIEFECRVVEGRGAKPAAGMVFAYREGDAFSLYLTETDVVLTRSQGGADADVRRIELTPPGLGVWHRLGAIVRGNKIEVWLDGKKREDHESTTRYNLTGELGVFQRDSKAEFRLMRSGKPGS